MTLRVSDGLTVSDLVYVSQINTQSANLKAIALSDFYASGYSVVVRNKSVNEESFSEVVFCVGLKRRSGYCFLNLFIPATAVVTSSWTSLWLEDQTQFADIFSILLSIIFLSFSFNTVMPRVSYIKVMDIYLGACFIFAFLSLVKLIIVKMLHRQIQKRSKRTSISLLKSHPLLSDSCSSSSNSAERTVDSLDFQVDFLKHLHFDHPMFQTVHDCFWLGAKVFHIISQVFLPIAFGIFGFFYFAIFPNIDYSSITC
ncbi:unnamed protein product [Soboliphyme baturini]|uniref:Neurotransmitter-gated ion-channel transmembrane domain-containing protein n=1 Tax=Soboliphyme baturini TaxID=241478 RepID=A0A3P8BC82_9BILA|nr:unnamed protein product [Soboliphyme baturini]